MTADRVAVLVVAGHIIAALNLPTGILFWDLFSHRCTLVPAAAKDGEILDIDELKDSVGVKFLDLEEFVWSVAADVSPQA